MKKLIFCWLLSVALFSTAQAQYGTARTGYEGDFFSLQGALDVFKQSTTLRDFERRLNTRDNWVNNLDLDYDGQIDYIRVEHQRQGNFHAIILQALVGRYDVQDVAVIELEILGRGNALLQIVGDEALYGEAVIVEPVQGYADSRSGYHSDYGNFVNVYYWQPVQYFLGRQYVVYVSPYRWSYYPVWWRPWAPCTWSVFRPRIVIYHRFFNVVHVHRVVHVHNFYRPYRSYSYTVVQRTNTVRVKHGKPPIHAVRQDNGTSGHRSRKDYEPRQGTTTRSTTPGGRSSVSRRTTPSSGQEDTRGRTAPQVQSRNTTTRSGATTRSTTPEPRSSVSRRSTSSSQKATRSTAPQVQSPSRSTTTRSGATTQPTTPERRSSVSRRSTSSGQKATRSKAPQARQQTRSTTTRSRTTTRSTTPERRSSVSRRSTSSGQKATRSTAPQARQQTRSTTTRSRATTRSTTPARKPSVSSRGSAPASKAKSAGGGSSKSNTQAKSRRRGN